MSDNDFTIIIDTREQKPFEFPDGVPTIVSGLRAGDYSIVGFQEQVSIERKSLADLYQTCGKGHERFERELDKLSHYRYSAVVIEATWFEIARRPPMRSRMKPKAVIASLQAWELRYGVHIHAQGPRPLAARLTYLMLHRFWRDKRDGKI